MQKTYGDFVTVCGRRYGWRAGGCDEKRVCPHCGYRFSEEDLVHDGYEGSYTAHGGFGSSGMGRHHFFAVCPTCSECDCPVCRRAALSPVERAGLRWADEGGMLVVWDDEYAAIDDECVYGSSADIIVSDAWPSAEWEREFVRGERVRLEGLGACVSVRMVAESSLRGLRAWVDGVGVMGDRPSLSFEASDI